MSIRLDKPWRPLSEMDALGGHLGVFQLADEAGEMLYIGCADARCLFGLRGAVADATATVAEAVSFRVEINTAYRTRYQELLMTYIADHGNLPPANPPEAALGRLSPA